MNSIAAALVFGGSKPKNILAWDGQSAPVTANIPSGVTVTYQGTQYTGTLAADSSTVGKTYFVKNSNPKAKNVFDEYVTVESGSSYVWELAGGAEIDLSGYQTKTDNTLPTTAKTVVGAITELSQGIVLLDAAKVSKPTAQTPYGYAPKSDGQGGYVWSALPSVPTINNDDILVFTAPPQLNGDGILVF